MKRTFTLLFIVPGVVALAIGLIMSARDGGQPNFPAATAMKVVTLKNGDTYDMVASYVTKEIGGVPQTMLAYNGSVPGPVIQVREGDTVSIRFKNNTGMETLLHSHGVRMENAFDGTHLVQDLIQPGETFTYTLTFPDPGAYWYHPHVREDLQQDLGLAGNFLVFPKDPNYWPKANREEVVILDDVLIEDGEIAPYSQNFATHVMMGRFGNTMLANGSEKLTLTAKTGEVVRYYFTNAANTRVFSLTMNGAKMKLVGADNGKYEKETFTNRVILAPSERAIVDVLYELPKTHTFMHDTGAADPTYQLLAVDVAPEVPTASYTAEFQTLRTRGAYGDALAAYRTYLGDAPAKTLWMTVDMDMMTIMQRSGGMMGTSDGHTDHSHGTMMGSGDMSGMMHQHTPLPIEWEDTMGAMNVFSTDKDTHWILRDMTGVTSAPSSSAVLPMDNADVHWMFNKGDLVKIRLFNDPTSSHPMHHPFHVHGQRFLVLSRDGVPNENLVWKDSVLVKMGETVDILVPMENVGKWMAHCHIAEHLTSGMMIVFDVLP